MREARLSQNSINAIMQIDNRTERRVTLSLYAYFHFYNTNISITQIQKDFDVRTNNGVDGITTRIKHAIQFFIDNGMITITTKSRTCKFIKDYTKMSSRIKFDVEVKNTQHYNNDVVIHPATFKDILKYAVEDGDKLGFTIISFFTYISSLIYQNKDRYNAIRIHPKSPKDMKRKVTAKSENGNNLMQLLGLSDKRIKELMSTLKTLKKLDYTYYAATEYNKDNGGLHIATPYYFYFDDIAKSKADKYVASAYKEKGASVFIDVLNDKVFRFYDGRPWDKENFKYNGKMSIYDKSKEGELDYCKDKRKSKYDFKPIERVDILFSLKEKNVWDTEHFRKPAWRNHYVNELNGKDIYPKINAEKFKTARFGNISPYMHLNSKAECLLNLFKEKIAQYNNDDGYKAEYGDLVRKVRQAPWSDEQFEQLGMWYIKPDKHGHRDKKVWAKLKTEIFKEDLEAYPYIAPFARMTKAQNEHLAYAFNKAIETRKFDYYFVKVGEDTCDKNGVVAPTYAIKPSLLEVCWKKLWNFLQYMMRQYCDLSNGMGIKTNKKNIYRAKDNMFIKNGKVVKEDNEVESNPLIRLYNRYYRFIKDFGLAMNNMRNDEYIEKQKQELKEMHMLAFAQEQAEELMNRQEQMEYSYAMSY